MRGVDVGWATGGRLGEGLGGMPGMEVAEGVIPGVGLTGIRVAVGPPLQEVMATAVNNEIKSITRDMSEL